MYKYQKSRGQDGFGFFLPQENKLAHNTREDRILGLLGKAQYQSSEILFHHRLPTSTDNVQNACHPFSTMANKQHFTHNYVLVHNGMVSNASSLKTDHEKLGIKYVSQQADGRFNDSEALLYDVALYLDGKQEKLNARGSIAFIVKSEGRTFFGRNTGSPLVYEMNSRGLTIRSEGSGTQVEANKLYEYLSDKQSFIVKDLEIPSYSYNYNNHNDSTYGYNYTDSRYIDADDDEVVYTQRNCSLKEYELAQDLALSLGSASEAIDWVQGRSKENELLLDKLYNQFETDMDDATAAAIDATEYEQEDLADTLTALWEVYLDEISTTYGRRQTYAY